ncbi:hypothetical protein CEXT_48561 [Caerostris extrusa]|uniref:Uncharacterized protein n=1 Tax=Caerostris extrusa TaxID=172846 RepID=A0AAV4N281_CAEEX|nr:hypothetical protein CEXT_48561 [Caerostris extrusa]
MAACTHRALQNVLDETIKSDNVPIAVSRFKNEPFSFPFSEFCSSPSPHPIRIPPRMARKDFSDDCWQIYRHVIRKPTSFIKRSLAEENVHRVPIPLERHPLPQCSFFFILPAFRNSGVSLRFDLHPYPMRIDPGAFLTQTEKDTTIPQPTPHVSIFQNLNDASFFTVAQLVKEIVEDIEIEHSEMALKYISDFVVTVRNSCRPRGMGGEGSLSGCSIEHILPPYTVRNTRGL